jgi:outer membrane immunogenic protein
MKALNRRAPLKLNKVNTVSTTMLALVRIYVVIVMTAFVPFSSPQAMAGESWDGLYAGLSLGWNGDAIGWQYHNGEPALGTQRTDNAIAGLHLGFQHQFGHVVLGAEVSGSGFLNDGNFGSTPCTNPAFACQARQNGALYEAGGRLGWASSPISLLYLSGGYANTNISTREVVVATGVATAFTTSDRHNGWYLGGGLDQTLGGNWILGLDYKHYVFETKADLVFNSPSSHDRDIGLQADAVRLRLSYKFGRPEAKHVPMK